MRRSSVLVALILSLVAVAAPAQVGMIFGGEVRVGPAWFSPNGDLRGASLDNSGGVTFDYTHMYGQHFAWNLNYMATSMGVSGPSLFWYRPRTNFNLQSFGFNLQFHTKFGQRVEPYIGAGVNYLYSNSSGGVLYPYGTGLALLTPSGGTSGGYFGPTFQVGLDWKISGPFLFNIEAKYMESSLKMDRYFSVGGPYSGYFVPDGTTKLRVNPFVLSAGIGFRW